MTLGQLYLKELEAEAPSMRKCIERVPEKLYTWKPHARSMEMGYLTLLVADIPKWLTAMIEGDEINFQTWEHYKLTTTDALVKRFDENLERTKKALQNVTDAQLKEFFYLKTGDTVHMKTPKDESVASTLNHWVHHRGQLSVYMRLNEIAVPSMYGPTADEPQY